MKKALLIGIALMLLAGVANAGPNSYIAVYFDEARTSYCHYPPAPFAGFTAWIWILPSDLGVAAEEFAVEWYGNGYNTGVTMNEAVITVSMGDLFSGISATGPCQYEWFWLAQLDFLPLDITTPGGVNIIPHPQYGTLIYSSCEQDNPIYDLIVLTNGYWNTDPCPEIAVESTSWGAIKSMYSE